MSSTISTGKLAAAFTSAKGNPFYVLFEESYESNVSPKTPGWSCVAFGDLQNAMKRIFQSASACEGGMLRYRGGRVLPENYIASWLRELGHPVAMRDYVVDLSVSDSFYSTWSHNAFQERKAGLLELKMDDIVSKLESGEKVKLPLHENAELLAELVKSHGVSHWRLINHADTSALPVQDGHLIYLPKPAKYAAPVVPEAMRLDEDNYLLQNDDGTWRGAGWAYSIVGQYIVNEVLSAELERPGCYKSMIKAMRDKLESSPKLDRDMTVMIRKELIDSKAWQVEEIKKRFDLQMATNGDAMIPVPCPFKGNSEDWYRLSRLGSEVAYWVDGLPEEDGQVVQDENPPGSVYLETEPVKIGSHQWRLVVLENACYGPVTQFQFRRNDAESQWGTERQWPTWNGNDTNCGLPPSLGEKIYQPHKALIEQALARMVVQPPQMSLF